MKKFLIKTAIFSLMILLSLIAGEILIRSINTPYSVKDKGISKYGDKIETIFFGNSHTYYGINTSAWPGNSFNLGNVSQPLAYDLRLLEHYVDSMPNLKRVVIEISLTSLFDDDMENTEEWWRCISYQLYNHLGVHPKLSKYSFELSYFPVYAEKVKTLLHLSAPKLRADTMGNGLGYDAPLSGKAIEQSGRANSEGHKKSSDFSRLPKNIRHLERIAEICKERNLDLYFFTQPHYRSYRENADTAYINRMVKEISAFANNHNARYYNLYADPRFTLEDYFDGDHLNGPVGAKKLTKILADSILQN